MTSKITLYESYMPTGNDKSEEEYYDIIIDINSLLNIKNGWKVIFNETGKKRYEESKSKKSCMIGVLGNSNRGKTFLLQLLTNVKLPTGSTIQTKGISIKYPLDENKNFLVIDTKGGDCSLLNENNLNLKELSDEEITNRSKDLSKDKSLIQYFLEKFVLENADVPIIVINHLNLTEQQFITKIKQICTNDVIYVVHNLVGFVSKSSVENYIKNILLKSLSYKVEKKYMYVQGNEEFYKNRNKEYYLENVEPKNLKNPKLKVIHLILAHEAIESEAGNYYNESTINYLRQQVMGKTSLSRMDIIEKVKHFLVNYGNEVYDDWSVKNKKEIEFVDNRIKIIDSIDTQKIQLKKIINDELGYVNIISTKNNPNYVYYFNKKNLQIVIKLEITGELQDKKIKIIDNTNSLMINISGNKVTNPIRLFSTRQSGPFNLQINFSKEKFNYQLSENEKYSEKYEDGIWCIIVNLAEIKNEEDIDF